MINNLIYIIFGIEIIKNILLSLHIEMIDGFTSFKDYICRFAQKLSIYSSSCKICTNIEFYINKMIKDNICKT